MFAWSGRAARARTVGGDGAHLKLDLSPGLGAIGFGLGSRAAECGGEINAAVSIAFDDWNGMRRVQLRIRDLRGG
jgi:single-stranded-DNA-specific exonuclease